MARFGKVLVLVVIVALLMWFNDYAHPQTRDEACTQLVPTSTEKAARGAVTAGDWVQHVIDGFTNAQVESAFHGAGNIVKIVWSAFKMGKQLGKVRADQAVTGMVPPPI